METSAYDIAMIGGGFTVIGALLSYWPARWLMDRQNIIMAKAKLRSSFSPAQSKIKLTPAEDRAAICNFIKGFIPEHAAAIEEFRPFVPKCDRDAYQKAWDDYCKIAQNDRPVVYREAASSGKIDVAGLFEEKIQGILSFAKNE